MTSIFRIPEKMLGGIPLRVVIIAVFVLQVVAAVGVTGYLSYTNGEKAVHGVVTQLLDEVTNRIQQHLDSYLFIPQSLNQINVRMVQQGLLKTDDADQMIHYFWQQGQLFKGYGSIGFANTDGEVFGVNEPENYIVISQKSLTGGSIIRYAPDANGNRTDQVLREVPNFDARTKGWYQAAVSAGGPTWAGITVSTTGIRLDVSAVTPVYHTDGSLQGVFYVDVSLAQINKYLGSLQIGQTGDVFIMDRNGMMVASSTDEIPFTVDPVTNQVQRLDALKSGQPLIASAAAYLKQANQDLSTISGTQQLNFTMQGAPHYLQVTPYHDAHGLDWLMPVVIPESDFMEQINAGNRTTLLLILVALVVAIVCGVATTSWVVRPILKLNASAKAIAKGEWGKPLATNRSDEVGELAKSFNEMTGQLRGTLDNLQQEIVERQRAEQALGSSEKRFRSLIENSTDGVAVLNRHRYVKYTSPAIIRLVGYSPGDTGKRDPFELVHAEDAAKIKILYRTVQQQPKTPVTGQFRFLHKNGTYKWIEATAINLLDEPAVEGIVVNCRDITESKEATERIQRQLQRLNALRMVDVAINASFDLKITLNVLLEHVITQLGVPAADILLYNPQMHWLEYGAARGMHTHEIEKAHIPLGKPFAGVAALERRTVRFTTREQTPQTGPFNKLMEEEGFVAYQGTPLIVRGEIIGVLEIYHRKAFETDPEWEDYCETLANQAAIAINSTGLFEKLQRSNMELTLAYDRTLEGWARALELRAHEPLGATRHMADVTVRLAKALGIFEETLYHVRRGVLLHDAGTIMVPDSILLKPGPLTSDEQEIMRRHPLNAFELLSGVENLRQALDIPTYHHEKWDGTGYPQQWQGEQIPFAARIFAVVDVWHALTSDRPYRPAWKLDAALAYLREQSGRHYDPRVVEMFLRMLDTGST